MPDTRPIAVFGAGGKAGTELLKHAFGRDVPIRAFEHNLPEPSERIGEFEYIDCDVLSDDFAQQLDGWSPATSSGPQTAEVPRPVFKRD